MKKMLLLIFCGLLLGCAGSNYGANGKLKGKILRPNYNPPGANNVDAEVYIEGKTGYKGPALRAPIDPNDGSFEIDINLGTESAGPPVVYVNSASFDLYLKVKGWWLLLDTTDAVADPFMIGVVVEADKTTDIGTKRLEWAWAGTSIWDQ